MRDATADHGSKRATLLAAALAETAAELRLVETADLVAFIRTGRWANIADLVQSSAELSFAEGALTFACSGEVAVGYVEPASVSLDMEFQHAAVTAFFTLTLAPRETRIEIKTLWFPSEPPGAAEATRRFEQALAAARIAPARLASR